jgi:pseudouridine synthase
MVSEMSRFLSQGADVDSLAVCSLPGSVQGEVEWTPLQAACFAGRQDVVRLLLTARADVGKARKDDGSTPLHIACYFGHAEIAVSLLAAGADLGCLDHHGNTPLDVASSDEVRAAVHDMLPSRGDAVEALRCIWEATGMLPHVAQCAVYHRYVCRPSLSLHSGLADMFFSNSAQAAGTESDGAVVLSWEQELDRRCASLAAHVREHASIHGHDCLVRPSPSLVAALALGAGCSKRQVLSYLLKLDPSRTYFIINKSRGVSSMRTKGRTVYSDLPSDIPHLPHVGRLDKQSEGLLLFTDDGRLSNALMEGSGGASARVHAEKEYHVQVGGGDGVSDAALEAMRAPLVIPALGGRLEPETVRAAIRVTRLRGSPLSDGGSEAAGPGRPGRGHSWISIVIDEGKKHQIRKLCASVGLKVLRLVRVSLGPLKLEGLSTGMVRYLTPEEVSACYKCAGLEYEKKEEDEKDATTVS